MQTNRTAVTQPRPETTERTGAEGRPHRQHRIRWLFVSAASIVALTIALTVLGPTSTYAISRNTVLARGQAWVDSPVHYSQAKRHLGYRTDCSGFVSMSWKTGTSWSTRTFHNVSHRIAVSALRPGDALLKKGYHIRLFYGWVDAAHTTYVAYESSDGIVAGTRTHSLADDLEFGYVPTRFDHISGSPAPRNILRNGTFDVWSKSWGSQSAQPVWWQSGGSWWQTFATHRKDTAHSSRSSLKLSNPSGEPATYAELAQSAPVKAGAPYRLTAWTKTAYDAGGVSLKLVYLDAAGLPVAEREITGEASHIDGTGFKSMSMLMTAPSGAVTALVSVKLAGGGTADASGTVTPGTSVILDDVSLMSPRVTAGISASTKSARNGRTVVVSGPVSPAGAIGASAVVQVQRPGSAWTTLSTSPVHASGRSAAWKGRMTFNHSMRRGTYRFRATIPAILGYQGITTNSVSVQLR